MGFSKWTILKILAVIALTAPLAASAASMPNIWAGGYWAPNGLVSCTGNYLPNQPNNGGPTNPCQSLCDLIQTVLNILSFIMTVALYVLMPIMFMWGAILLMMGGARPEMLSSGKKMLTGAVIGVAIILGSYLIVNTVVQVVAGVGGGSGFGVFGGNANCSSNNNVNLPQ